MIDMFLFWIALSLLAYLYFGYPAAAWVRARFAPKPHRRGLLEPTVTVVVVAYNEAERIDARLENLLALDYPRHKLEIILASDGSTDGTVERARRFADAGVQVQAFDWRRGKAAVLNDVVASATGEIVVLADARQLFETAAVRALTANFVDPAVGAVSGELMLNPTGAGAAAGEGPSFYWRYEKFIRRNESRFGSTVGATGAIYAIRRELFQPIPEDTILDDVLIPMRIVARGYRVVFEPAARAYDCASATARQEFVRKVRTIAGMFQLFARERWLFNPARNGVWFETLSHKGLRLLAPLLQIVVLMTSVALRDVTLYRWMVEAQIVFYGAASVGYTTLQMQRRLRVLTVPYTICLMNWATVVGCARFATGRQRATWDRVALPSPTRSSLAAQRQAETPSSTRALLRS